MFEKSESPEAAVKRNALPNCFQNAHPNCFENGGNWRMCLTEGEICVEII